MRRILLVLALLAALLVAAPAHAGTYVVKACAVPSGVTTNHSWAFSVPSTNWSSDTTCTADSSSLQLTMLANTATPAFQTATITFTPPAGATLRDFDMTRQIYYYNPVRDSGTAPPYILYSWGGVAYEGMGEYDAATRDAINAYGNWYGYPSGALDTGAQEVTKASFGRLTGVGDAGALTINIGCWATACSLDPTANVFTVLYGTRITVADESRPSLGGIPAGGLLAAGSVGGDEPVSFTALDNVGIRRVELLDVTDPAHPAVAGDRTIACDYTRPRPCADVHGGNIAPGSRLPSGARKIAVRVTDTAGNQTTSPARDVLVGGPLNGINAGAGGRLRAVFTKGRKTRRTVHAGGQPSVSLTLRNAAAQPIGGARLQVLSRPIRDGAHYKLKRTLRTDAKGRARYVVAKGSSRELRFEYRRRVDDPSAAMRAKVRLGVRPRVTLHVRPGHVGPGGRITLSGRVLSRPRPRPGKIVVLQAFDRGHWRPLATTRSGKRGRFSHRYRFTRASGRSFRFRARLPREAAYPYSTGNSRTVTVRVG